MALALALASREALLVATLLGAAVYTAVLLTLMVWSLGGPSQVRARYLGGWVE